MKDRKVFSIGFQKTGTTSIGDALEILGYRVCGYHGFRDLAHDPELTMERLLERARSLTIDHDAFKDTPWPVLYKQLDEWYPGSKFIHVVRDTDRWIQSAAKDFGDHPNMIHRLIYGCDYPVGNEDIWRIRYERHNREVVEYFSERPCDCITLRMDAGQVGWDTVCSFLGVATPDASWPHANKMVTKKRKMLLQRTLRKLGIRAL